MRPLILLGGGGHCRSVIDTAKSAGYIIRGVLDPEGLGETVIGDIKIIGNDDDIPKYVNDCDFIVTLGFIKNPAVRIKLHEKIKAAGGHFATVIAPTAHVSKYAEVGEGTVILQNATVNAGAKIGFGCIINTASNIEHDAVIGDYCHISTGAMINGEAKVGERSFVGSQAVIANCIEVPACSVVGAGAVMFKSTNYAGIYIGNPATMVK